MSVFNNILLGASSQGGVTPVNTIDQSIRFNASDSAYLNRTPSSAGNQKTWTLSWWFKRGDLSTNYSFFNRRTGSGGATNFLIYLMTDDRLQFYASNGSTIDNPITTRKFRDTGAWYHCVATLDTTQTPIDQRFRVYINGVRETLTGDTFLYDTNYLWNDAQNHAIGRQNYQNDYYLDAYMSEIVFIDGTSLNADSFGEYNSSGIWVPKNIHDQSFTFGTNGFYLTGQDASNLGNDYQTSDRSGTTNDFTATNFETNDQVPDTPTNNQITFNPLNNQRSGGTPKNGNLEYHGPGTRTLISLTAAMPSTGKWVVAMTANSMGTAVWNFGVNLMTNTNYGDAAGSNEDLGRPLGIHQYPYSGWFTNYFENSSSGTQISPSPSITPTTSDEFWCAIDMATGKVFMGIYDADDSGSGIKWLAQDGGLDGNPETGDNPTYTFSDFINNQDVTFGFASKNSSTTVTLLREDDCTGTVPTGFTYFENVKDLIGS